jgi:hypothetical protein
MHNHRIAAGSLTVWLRRGLFLIALALAACGGGGSGSGSSSTTSSSSGSSSGASPQNSPAQPAVSNAVTVSVAQGVEGTPNIPTVSVTLCAPGTSNCQTIDNIQVDTESFGLRLLSSQLSSSVAGALPTSTVSGGTLAECANFADGFMWGTIRTADVKIAGETASSVPIQVVGDLSASTIPAACQGLGTSEDTQADVGANGILGIGVALADCDATCVADAAGYYACPNGTNCVGTVVTTPQEVANPVAHFTTDNNGVSLQLPQVGSNGAASATGTLLFGIGTESNNALTATQKLATNGGGDVTGTFNGSQLTTFLDSGSNGLFFNDSAITQCTGASAGFFCPASPVSLSATQTGTDGSTASASFGIANAASLFNTGNLAFDNLGGSFGSQQVLDLGMPFLYGRTVFYGFDQRASGGAAPYIAF